jgi:hypothetical protein
MENELTVNDIVNQSVADKKTSGDNSSQQNQGGANPGDGNNAGAGDGKQQQDNQAGSQQNKQPDAISDLLKEIGIESVDVLKQRLAAPPPAQNISPEEKEKQENIYRADLQRFAVENGGMKLEDFSKIEAVKAKADKDLVYENWLPEWKEENPDVDPAEADKLAKEAFEDEYKLSSTNEKAKARGESRLKKDAAEIRNPLESSFNNVKGKFDELRSVQATYPAYSKKVNETVSASIPAELDVYTGKINEGKEDEETVPVKISLDDNDRKEILKSLTEKFEKSPSAYALFKKGDAKSIEDFTAMIKSETENYVWAKKKDIGLKQVADDFLKKGIEKARIGATNSFAINQNNPGGSAGKSKQSAEREVLDSLEKGGASKT